MFSSTFGPIDPAPLREAGIVVLGTATTVEEAQALEATGVDAVVVQSAEAGGHRGTFLGSFEECARAARRACCRPSSLPCRCRCSPRVGSSTGRTSPQRWRPEPEPSSSAPRFSSRRSARRRARGSTRCSRATRSSRPRIPGRPGERRARRSSRSSPPRAAPLPYPLQRAVIADLATVDGYGFYLGGTAAPRARELPVRELVRTLVAETEAAQH